MSQYHEKSFPGESDAYRTSRDALLEAEIALRKQTEEVAALRRELPLGGEVPEDYEFKEPTRDGVQARTLSSLFEEGKDSLVIYSLMFAPGAGSLPMVTCCEPPSVFSCMTTVSAPGGISAPVKIRAAVPGLSVCGSCPAGMRCETTMACPSPGQSA